MHTILPELREQKLYTPSDVARLLNNHPSACVRWIQRGVLLKDGTRLHLAALRVPGAWRIAPVDLERFLEIVKADALKCPEDAPTMTQARSEQIAEMRRELKEAGYPSA